ncbi:MAG TPA: aminotransferase class IV [Acidimicrobiales bacterium]|jgi:branched-chain amino acid aminotransferase|nr:aminotransferase class IV [Acidimicrobiales bacterium]
MMGMAWVDGAFVGPEQPALSAFDHGVLLGDGVYETMAVVDGRAVALDRHLARLHDGLARLGIDAPSRWAILTGVNEVLGADPLAGRLRITVTSGPGPLGTARGRSGPTLVVSSGPPTVWAPTAKVATVPWTRNERSALAGVKSTSHAENVVALAAARQHGADEAMLANTVGELCEGAGSNVFVGIGGRLMTPPVTSGCLPGVTRALVIEALGPGAVEETPLPYDALARANEAFLTSATRGVHPIETVDGTPLPHCPGPLTGAAAAALARAVSEDG